jgi:hypothetical protein
VTAPTSANPIQGIIAGGGTVYSFDPDSANPTATMRLEAWGMRNPYGIGFDPFNPKQLFISNNGADVRQTTINGKVVIRGNRPIDNDYDDLFVARVGEDRDADRDRDSKDEGSAGREVPFFGHPDYFHDPISRQPLPVTNPMFCPKEGPLPTPPPPVLASPCSQFAFSDSFRAKLKPQPAFAEIELHSSANMFDFSRTEAFGFKRDIFIAETGAFPPGTGATLLTGFKIARIGRNSGLVSDFVSHPGCPGLLTSLSCQNTIFPLDNQTPPKPVLYAFNKPIDVRFRGHEMFIVDFGVLLPGTYNSPNSGKIWKVTRIGRHAGEHGEDEGEH